MDRGWFCRDCGADKRLSIVGKPNWQIRQRKLCADCCRKARVEAAHRAQPYSLKFLIGQPSHNKGKKYKRTEEYKESRREIMLANNPMKNKEVAMKAAATKRANGFYAKISEEMINGKSVMMNSCIQNPSKPQVALFNIVKGAFSEAVLNYPVYRPGKGKRHYSIDIAIPGKGIAIEYDGRYHFYEQKRANMDALRQKNLEDMGWNFIRYNIFQKFPTKEQVLGDISLKAELPLQTLNG